MGFFDKVKNMFTEEIDDEVKVEKIKNDVTHVAIESPVENKTIDPITKEILQKFQEEPKKEIVPIPQEDPEPIQNLFFDDDDFNDLDYKQETNEEIREDYYEKPPIYREVKEEAIDEGKFKPTPIISPVYGVLDKNYHKEDIISKDEVKYQREEDPVDSIRNKAYGTLEDELENTMFGQNSILFKPTPVEEPVEDTDSLLDEYADDIGKELDELLDRKTRSHRYEDIIDEMEEPSIEEYNEPEESKNFFDVEQAEDLKDPEFDIDLIGETFEENNEEPVEEIMDAIGENIEEEEDKLIEEPKIEDIEEEDLLGFINSTLYDEGEDE